MDCRFRNQAHNGRRSGETRILDPDISAAAASNRSLQNDLDRIESRDTGERRQMFGYPARRFITTDRRHTEFQDKPPSEFLETVTDGWYLDVPFWTPKPHVAVAVLTADNPSHPNVPPKIEVTRLGPTPKGLPVWEKRGDSLMEVTELSHAELDPKLFEPPSGFRRAIHPMPDEQLSWSEKILFGWQQFEDWIGSSTAPWKK